MIEHPVDVRFPSRRSVLSSSRADGNQLTLFVPTEEPIATGAALRLYCSFGDSDRHFVIVGSAAFRREGDPGPGQNRGVVVQFHDTEQKKSAAEMIAFCAGRAPDQGTSTSPRVPTAIACLVRIGSNTFPAEVKDLSVSGAFVSSAQLSKLKSGTDVSLQLEPRLFGLLGTTLKARLLWSGQKNGRVGFGARFTQDPNVVRPALKKFLK
jgi:hypothetical protein